MVNRFCAIFLVLSFAGNACPALAADSVSPARGRQPTQVFSQSALSAAASSARWALRMSAATLTIAALLSAQAPTVSIKQLTEPITQPQLQSALQHLESQAEKLSRQRFLAQSRYPHHGPAHLVYIDGRRLDLDKIFDHFNQQERDLELTFQALIPRYADWETMWEWTKQNKLRHVSGWIHKALKDFRKKKKKSGEEPSGALTIFTSSLFGDRTTRGSGRVFFLEDLPQIGKWLFPLALWVAEEWFFRGKWLGEWHGDSGWVAGAFILLHMPRQIKEAYAQYRKGIYENPYLDPPWAKSVAQNMAMRVSALILGTTMIHSLFVWIPDWQLSALVHLLLNATMFALQSWKPWLWPATYLSIISPGFEVGINPRDEDAEVSALKSIGIDPKSIRPNAHGYEGILDLQPWGAAKGVHLNFSVARNQRSVDGASFHVYGSVSNGGNFQLWVDPYSIGIMNGAHSDFTQVALYRWAITLAGQSKKSIFAEPVIDLQMRYVLQELDNVRMARQDFYEREGLPKKPRQFVWPDDGLKRSGRRWAKDYIVFQGIKTSDPLWGFIAEGVKALGFWTGQIPCEAYPWLRKFRRMKIKPFSKAVPIFENTLTRALGPSAGVQWVRKYLALESGRGPLENMKAVKAVIGGNLTLLNDSAGNAPKARAAAQRLRGAYMSFAWLVVLMERYVYWKTKGNRPPVFPKRLERMPSHSLLSAG